MNYLMFKKMALMMSLGGQNMEELKIISTIAGVDDTWAKTSFTLDTIKTSGYITVDNPLGIIPNVIVVEKELTNENITFSGVIGGINIGGTKDDNNNNRTIRINTDSIGGYMTPNISKTLWNLINSSCPNVTPNNIYFRTGTDVNIKWGVGKYNVYCK